MKYIFIISLFFLLIGIFEETKTVYYKPDLLENNENLLYYGILEIPKINLNKEFYPFNSEENTVAQNIELISENCDVTEPCNFILASHSGDADISFFKNLNKLTINDIAFIVYKNQKYQYYLEKILYQEKKGYIILEKTMEPKLILTTCNEIDQNLQNIYVFKKVKSFS